MPTIPKSDQKLRHLDSVMGYFTDEEWEVFYDLFISWKDLVLRLYE